MQIGQTLPEAVVDIPQKPFGFRGPHTTASGNTKREPSGSLFYQFNVKIRDMRVDFYSLDVRKCRAMRGARRERTNIQTEQNCVLFESVSA